MRIIQFSELTGNVQGPVYIGIILSLEFLCTVYLSIAHLKSVHLEGHARLEIAHKQFFVNGMAVPKSIAVKKDVTDDRTACQSRQKIVVSASFTAKIPGAGQTRL